MGISSLNICRLSVNPFVLNKSFCLVSPLPCALPGLKMFMSFNSEINLKEMIKNEDHNVHYSMLS